MDNDKDNKENCCTKIQSVFSAWSLTERIACTAALIAIQGGLDWLIVAKSGQTLWLLWLIADIIVICMFLFALAITIYNDATIRRRFYGALIPLAGDCWGLFAAILVAKLAVLYSIGGTSVSAPFPLLSIFLALQAPLCLFFLRSNRIRKLVDPFIKASHDLFSFFFLMDLMDSIDLLRSLSTINTGIRIATIVIVLISYLVPMVQLGAQGAACTLRSPRAANATRCAHLLTNAVLVQCAFFVIRVVRWSLLPGTATLPLGTAFLVKEGVCLYMLGKEFLQRLVHPPLVTDSKNAGDDDSSRG